MRGSYLVALSGLYAKSWAHPFHDASSLETSANPLQARQLSSAIDRFRPRTRSNYVSGAGDVARLSAAAAGGDYIEIATRHLTTIHPDVEFRRTTDSYVSSSGVGHVYFKQTLHGLDIDDADFNVNVNMSQNSRILPLI